MGYLRNTYFILYNKHMIVRIQIHLEKCQKMSTIKLPSIYEIVIINKIIVHIFWKHKWLLWLL